MLVYSLGHAAARDTTSGTLFVKSIHDVFREHAKTKDILTLMTQVKSSLSSHLKVGVRSWAPAGIFSEGGKIA